MMRILKTTIAFTILSAYIAFGSFLMMGMMDHHPMDGGCPFMPGEQVVCQMDAFDHISAWQSTFVAIVPTILALSILAAVIVLTWRHCYPPPDFVPIRIHYQRRTESVITPFYQELFSSGILNPKIP